MGNGGGTGKAHGRIAQNILRNKIHRDGLQFPPEVIDYIAENVGNSVRDLEGIVISIMAHSTIYNKEIDLELAQRIVRKVVNCESKAITIDDIITTVCKHFGLEMPPYIQNRVNAKWCKPVR